MHFAAAAFLPHRGGWRCEFCKEFAAISPSWRKCLASSALRRRPFCVPKRAPLHGNAARFNPQGGPFRNGGRPEPPLLPRFVNILLRQGRFAVRQRQWHCHCLQAMRQYPGLQSAQCFPRCAGNHEKTHFIEKKAPKVLQFQKNALNNPDHTLEDGAWSHQKRNNVFYFDGHVGNVAYGSVTCGHGLVYTPGCAVCTFYFPYK